jgi:hypothetical protein
MGGACRTAPIADDVLFAFQQRPAVVVQIAASGVVAVLFISIQFKVLGCGGEVASKLLHDSNRIAG